MKKAIWTLALAAVVWGGAAATPAAAQEDAVLLVAPARFEVMQVAFDVARRYPTVLVSYQGAPAAPTLHVWNGYEWMALALADYQGGAFLQSYPGRTVFLGGDDLLPASLREIGAWCPRSTQIPVLERHALVNAIGSYLPFTPADWRWFAGRYNLTLKNVNAEKAEAARRETWYDGAGQPQEPPPSFFKYFTRSRRRASAAPIQPVEVAPEDVVETPAP
jgi:hypothetical protein